MRLLKITQSVAQPVSCLKLMRDFFRGKIAHAICCNLKENCPKKIISQ
jgi:hypothetical protein